MKSDCQQVKESSCPQEQAVSQPSIIYEDNHIIVVIKPQNIPCCPDDSKDDNLLDQIKQYRKDNSDSDAVKYVGLIHRLDRVTGGVMVYAKTSKAASRLSEQIKSGEFDKKYLAVVIGEPKHREQELVDYLHKNEIKNIVTVVPFATKDAKRAELKYKLVKTFIKPPVTSGDTPFAKGGTVSLVEIKLVTGRSHQIRVQMANIGCPVFGDSKYGGDKLGKGWNLALWAHELCFTHPTTGDKLRFIVNPPESVPWDKFEFDRKPKKGSGV